MTPVHNGIVFIDIEVDFESKKVLDIGAIKDNGCEFHSSSLNAFSDFLHGSKYVCGHNIINHDIKYLDEIHKTEFFIDTLHLSPLLFPKKPYHSLVKDDKIDTDELNNPLNDAKKARDLFYDEVAAFTNLKEPLRHIYHGLLGSRDEFRHFFSFLGYDNKLHNITGLIYETYAGKLCANSPIEKLTHKYPVELAYVLALISVIEYETVTPRWVTKSFPRVENVLRLLRSRKCLACPYCEESLDEVKALKRFFHYDNFRNYDGIPLQQSAVKAAVEGKSVLAVFPTGGGKSITFQLPALMAGANEKGLTIVISPLQSLMKDQTDNLEKQHNITEAVTINGSLDPLERAKAFERVEGGSASILYISPESLRSKSVERLLLGRNVVRFVIDEAHCFSSWGQDFRVDYLYIGEFIANLQKIKDMNIPVSCFTATAKQKVIADIKDYFRNTLSLELELFRASAARTNLSYHILVEDSKEGKDLKLRQLLYDNYYPTIIYVSRTRKAEQLAAKLTEDGFPARPYHGRMDKQLRALNQDAFMNGEVNIIVATTAFGMGVDKKDIGMVIHYDISDSLENYVQEAGRAGRDENIHADCYALYADEDLNKHFNMLNQTKLTQKEIKQVWKAIKESTKERPWVSQSALEIARLSGWDDSVLDMETRVKTAISALEQSGFIKRGQNMPRIFADSILVKSMIEARKKIDSSPRFDDTSRLQAARIMKDLFSARSKQRGQDAGESRVDYISDRLGAVKEDVIRTIGLLREEKILSDDKDLVAFINKKEQKSRPKMLLSTHNSIEHFLCRYLDDEEKTYNIKEMNEALEAEYENTSIKQLGTILNYFAIKRFVKRIPEYNKNHVTLKPYFPPSDLLYKSARRNEIAGFIIDYLYAKASFDSNTDDNSTLFSVLELKNEFNQSLIHENSETEEIEDALYYLLKIGALKIEGGFLVIYNAMRIERLERDNRAQYRNDHYKKLEDYYKNKRQQIHIVGEYANLLSQDYLEAMVFIDDYFLMDYNMFLNKYFKGKEEEISKNITPKKYKQLFGELSPSQLSIIEDSKSKYIVVAAGPGSGKTKLLAHKLASLYMMEDIKHEQMLMLTFSRAAATEFKMRLMALIGNAANFIQITTFHSYCFDLMGKVGDISKSDKIIEQTVDKINACEIDLSRLTKTVLVIDEAQDMSAAEYSIVKTLIDKNEEMRVIAVGDDDQNIYEFRGSDSAHFASLLNMPDAVKYELIDNYRSCSSIVNFANHFAKTIVTRLKTLPIVPKINKRGNVSLCRLSSNNVETPVVNALFDMMPTGSTCVITRTNKEALNIVGLLQLKGIPAKQIQSNDDFSLQNLVELRDFADYIGLGDTNYTINDEIWQHAKSKLIRKYEGSDNLRWILKLLKDFEATHNKAKYKSDYKQFIHESKLEDFIWDSEGAVLVSTIHQTKGREFDNVFLALSRFSDMNDEAKRAIYVAITRAKQNLHIFCNNNYFDEKGIIDISIDENTYDEPSRLCFQLSHKDVFLDHFTKHKKEINSLMSGHQLLIADRGCFLGDTLIVKFSAKFNEQIEGLKARGYIPAKAFIRHIVFWQGKGADNEIKIILPNVEFNKTRVDC